MVLRRDPKPFNNLICKEMNITPHCVIGIGIGVVIQNNSVTVHTALLVNVTKLLPEYFLLLFLRVCGLSTQQTCLSLGYLTLYTFI